MTAGESLGRRHVSSGGPWETRAGYSRVVAVGDRCWVAGTTDAGPDGRSVHPGDVEGQLRASFAIVEAALVEAGFARADIVRTRMYVTDIAASAPVVVAVHGELFGEVRPAATLVEVSGLIEPSLLVEVEVEACKAT